MAGAGAAIWWWTNGTIGDALNGATTGAGATLSGAGATLTGAGAGRGGRLNVRGTGAGARGSVEAGVRNCLSCLAACFLCFLTTFLTCPAPVCLPAGLCITCRPFLPTLTT